MKFVLEVDMTGMSAPDEAAGELGRILRYWGGSMKQVELTAGAGQDIYDSAYRRVGRWEVVDKPNANGED